MDLLELPYDALLRNLEVGCFWGFLEGFLEGFDSELDVTVKIKVLGFENLESFEGFGG